jgi:23S rRNA (cytidine1920-2'-O)/16S rRNA (cytidine1409-2'-O)-methyltransferase
LCCGAPEAFDDAMKSKNKRKRLDLLLVERGLARTQEMAQAMILAGEVRVNGQGAHKAGAATAGDARIAVQSRALRYASRGGFKLEGALEDFDVTADGKICLDVGASTGGFTDCLLQQGAARVYAVDVNTDQLAWKLREDARVVLIKRNARELRREDIPEPVDLIVADVSFIAVERVLAPAAAAGKDGADLLILVKPQFELARELVGAGGIVKDTALHEKAIKSVQTAAAASGLECIGVRPSRLTGAEGNQEYFLYARKMGAE